MVHCVRAALRQRPVQGYRIDIPLPPEPADFTPVSFDPETHRALVPVRIPPSATFLAQLEWAWSPQSNAIVRFSLSLNGAKSHWIGWLSRFDDHECLWDWETSPSHIDERRSANGDTLSVHMFRAMLEGLRDGKGYGRFNWIHEGGYLGVHRIEAIGDRVWGRKQ